jgi:N-acyl-D-amino-acid deacylase
MFIMDEDDVRRVVADGHSMIGSDGLPSGGKPHPRLYGTMARVLEKYVREDGVLSLEEAVRKMTSLPAARLGLRDRGQVREGYKADLVVFDRDTVGARSDYAEPRRMPAGIEHVFVNGRHLVEGAAFRPEPAGAVLRRAAA